MKCKQVGYFSLIFWLFSGILAQSDVCTLRLYEVNGDKAPGSNGFSIEIAGHSDKSDIEPTGYIPGKSYKSKQVKLT